MNAFSKLLAPLAVCALAAPAWAADGLDTLSFPLLGGTPSVDLRLRWELADNEAAANPEDSQALTLRSRIGYTTGKWNGLDLGVEYEGTNAVDKDSYNSGTPTAFSTNRPPIVDPTGAELNQAWLRYAGIPWTTLKVGRSRYVLDNHRFIGNVGWRQNEATFDGFSAVIAPAPVKGLEFQLAHFDALNSITFASVPGDYELANFSYAPAEWLKASLYGYFLDFSLPAAAANSQRQDSQTIGLRLAGSVPVAEKVKLLYTAEYAQQSDYADAPAAVDADYLVGELGVTVPYLTIKFGYEELGSNAGTYALQTPLATLHAFNGWADVFLTTPATGLRDTYVHLGGAVGAFGWMARAHQFEADFGGADYGHEYDLQTSYQVTKQLGALVKWAKYDAEAFATDTQKGWVQVEFKF